MKITVTEIEANAEELRQSNTLSDSLARVLRNAFNNVGAANFSNLHLHEDDDEDAIKEEIE